MQRHRQRKTVEELYGGKFETSKSLVPTTNTSCGQKTARITERDYGYIISSNTPYNGPTNQNISTVNSSSSKAYNSNSGKETSRRKSARPFNKSTIEKHGNKESFEVKALPITNSKNEKIPRVSPVRANMYDNKICGTYKDIPGDGAAQHHQHHHQHNNHNNHHYGVVGGHDEDKDDDTDEFFELIRRTVESAIGKSISELLNRNFRELSTKVERFSAELKNTNALLNQMQNEINNKIIHYGEENSRHFRYLCMKSEYDKMFYQHQTLIASTTPPICTTLSSENKKPEKRKIVPKLSNSLPKMQHNEIDKPSTSANCSCHTPKSKSSPAENKQVPKTSSEDLSQKSSEVGMREVLEHIQKFCNQMQMNDFRCDQKSESDLGAEREKFNTLKADDLKKINKEIFAEDDELDEEDDDDDWDVSSDGMTPRNRENKNLKLGGNTARGGTTQRGNIGAGDA